MYGRPTNNPWPWWEEWDDRSVPVRRVDAPRRPAQAESRIRSILARTPSPAPAESGAFGQVAPPSGDGAVRVKRRLLDDEPTPLGDVTILRGGPEPEAARDQPAKSESASGAPPKAQTSSDERMVDALADLAAARQRVERDAQRVLDETRAKLVEQLIPALDNLDRSIGAVRQSTDQALLDGIRMVRDQFEQVLADYGVEVIHAEGAPFDPSIHDALSIAYVDDPAEEGQVVGVEQRGYRMNGRLLRAARVRVGKVRQRIAATASELD